MIGRTSYLQIRCGYTLLLALELLITIWPIPTEGDADFNSVRVRLDYADSSGHEGDPPGKYWRA